ncbi:efflux RND transporter periplasmic adaptor subunit [Synechococcus sp. CS-1328]|uniref:efflux RND transporter periplasmic adaptor subunit n=1 Tax=Synechococcus sp. CS-1328 TaxID=2847976 RepID=UPI00223AB2A5|nr:efflux RND transporter periplasmic adaptor subunit [Synechococcus sp. CS-1328]MCT0223983.1 efflux RND transporter periplasmic adaptor subunit [Synechococcus sp. CS-1328]
MGPPTLTPSRTGIRKRLPLIALLTVGLACGGWLLWQQNRRSQEERALAAQTTAVQQRAIAIRVTAAGSIRPITPVNISPKQPGRVSQLLVDQGDRVVARPTSTNCWPATAPWRSKRAGATSRKPPPS